MKTSNRPTKQEPSLVQLAQFLGFVISVVTEIVSEIATKHFYLLGSDNAKALLQNKDELKKRIRKSGIRETLQTIFPSNIDPYYEVRRYWERFYLEQFNIVVDFSDVLIPEMSVKGKWRLIFIVKGMTMNKAFARGAELFNSGRMIEDLDVLVVNNIRTASENYAVWVEDSVEPDARYIGQSIKFTDPDMKIGITLLERIIFEIVYFKETTKHLDINGVTLCSGSRDADGKVAGCGWRFGKFWVVWYGVNNSLSSDGIRSVIAL